MVEERGKSSGGRPRRDRDADDRLEEGLKESFPASDPPAVDRPTRTGEPGENRKRGDRGT